jgi:predicted PurR-regulated permease PerM
MAIRDRAGTGDGRSAATASSGRPPAEPRPEVPPTLHRLAGWSWRLLAIGLATGLIVYLLILLKVVVIPVIVALFLATLLVPLVRWLETRGWPHLGAVVAVFLAAVLLVVVLISVFVPLIGNEIGPLRSRVDEGITEVTDYLAGPPLRLSQDDLDRYVAQAREQLSANSRGITRGVAAGAVLVGELLTGLVLTFFLTFFFVKDSERFTSWILDFIGERRREDARELGHRAATAVSGYLRGQATVGLVDAVFIGIGPLAALIVVGITVAVQQLEGHVLAPLLLGRAVALHPVVIILALGAGSILGGIVGAFLAVPVAAVIVAAGTYLRGRPVGEPAEPGEPEPQTSARPV